MTRSDISNAFGLLDPTSRKVFLVSISKVILRMGISFRKIKAI